MNKTSILVFGLAILFASFSLAAPPIKGQSKQDIALTKKIVGKWQVEVDDRKNKRKSIGWTVYASNGMCASRSITKPDDGKEFQVILEAKWYILQGRLVTQVTKSSNTRIVKVGHTTREQLRSLSDTQLKYIDDEGKDIVETRVPDDPPAKAKPAPKK